MFGYHLPRNGSPIAATQVNYRFDRFARSRRGEPQFRGKMHDDLIDAVKWAVAGIAIPDKVAIGRLGGGYATLVG